MYKKLVHAIFLLIFILLLGTCGYVLIENWSFFDAIYMTVITLATVGYGEIHPLNPSGRVFTIILILSGMGSLLYAVSLLTSFFIEGELGQIFKRQKMIRKISQLRNHYIICGAGRVGIHIISELAKTKRDLVIVEKSEKIVEKFQQYLYIKGDASEEEILEQAGIKFARGLFAALSTDEENMYLIVTARAMNSNLRIISKSVDDSSVKKLLSAGASSVVSTNLIGGLRMASEMLRPTVVSFLDTMLKEGKGNLRIEEVAIKSPAVKTISQIEVHKKNALLIAISTEKEGYKFNPSVDTVVSKGDKLIVMGTPEQISEVKELCSASSRLNLDVEIT